MAVLDQDDAIERLVVERFPYPIAVNLAYARRARGSRAPVRELAHLFVTFEVMLQFLGAASLIDAASRGEAEERAERIKEILGPRKNGWIPDLDNPSIAVWRTCISACIKHAPPGAFLAEFDGWSNAERKALDGAFKNIQGIRNELRHPEQRPSPPAAMAKLGAVRAGLCSAFLQLAFLGDYLLVAVERILPRYGKAYVTSLRGARLPSEGNWANLGPVADDGELVLLNRSRSQGLSLYPFFLARPDQDDADRLWAYGGAAKDLVHPGYNIIDRYTRAPLRLEAPVPNPRTYLLDLTTGAVRKAPRFNVGPGDPLAALDPLPPTPITTALGLEELAPLPSGRTRTFSAKWTGRIDGVAIGSATWLTTPSPGERVVIKTGTSTADYSRIVGEFSLLEKIEHANVIRPLGLLATASGCPILVLPWLGGERLLDVLQAAPNSGTGTIEKGEAERIAEALVSGLAAIHQHGAHGDLKPANVLYQPAAGTDTLRVVILDLDAGVDDSSAATEPTSVVGTRGYAAPELWLPGEEHPDRRRSDLYSLAVFLYEVFASRPPRLDMKGEGIDVTAMPAPRKWRLITRWCGMVHAANRPSSIDDVLQVLDGRFEPPEEVGAAVPFRSTAAQFWGGVSSLVAVVGILATLLIAVTREEPVFLTLPVLAVAVIIWRGARGAWAEARTIAPNPRGALIHLAGGAGLKCTVPI